MFVSHQRFRRNPKTLHNDKRLPKGSISERTVTPFLERWCNPKGNLAYKYFFEMHRKKEFVTPTELVAVTPAQLRLLRQLDHLEAEDYYQALQTTYLLATHYVSETDLKDDYASLLTLQLQWAVQEIYLEKLIENIKNEN